MKQNQQREKVHDATSRGNQAQDVKGLLSVLAQRRYLIPQQLFGTKHVERCLPGKLLEIQCPRFKLEVNHIGIHCLSTYQNARFPEESQCLS